MNYHYTDFVNEKSVLFREFEPFIQTCSLKEFLHVFKFPFLVGADTFAGSIGDDSGQDTVQFQMAEDPSETHNDGKAGYVSKRLFYLSVDARNVKNMQLFHVGRTIKSNITIVDYTISKNHAFLKYEGGQFSIKNLSTTNVTLHNNVVLDDTEEYTPVEFLDSIGFGRMRFVLVKPLHLFLRFRTSYSFDQDLETELPHMLRFTAARLLRNIASIHKIDTADKSRRALLQELIDTVPSEQLLMELL